MAEPSGKTGAQGRLRRLHAGLWTVLGAVAASLVLVVAVLALAERRIVLPGTVTAWVEARLDAQLHGIDLDLAEIAVGLDRQAVPRLWIDGLRLTGPGGAPIADLAEIGVAFDPAAALRGRIAPRVLRLDGAGLVVRRDADGAFEFRLGGGGQVAARGLGELLDDIDATLRAPPFDRIDRVDLRGAVITLDDARSARVWQATDARLSFVRAAGGTRVSVLADLFDGSAAMASLQMSVATSDADSRAELAVQLGGVPAAGIAAQAPALAVLGVLDAPLSGALRATLDEAGALASLAGTLEIGAGALRPRPGTPPVAFDAARAYFDFDPKRRRLHFSEISVRSEAGSARLTGHADLQSPDGGGRAALVAQLAIEALAIDAPELFEAPVAVRGGAVDLRLGLDPFRMEIGQLVLPDPGGDPDRHLRATGRVDARAEGWQVAVDLSAAKLSAERLRALWPRPVARKTRAWIEKNLLGGEITNGSAALRYATGDAKPELSTTFSFEGARVRALRTLPPITGMAGYGSLMDRRFAVALDDGGLKMPDRAPLDLAGTTMVVPDTRIKPSPARFAIKADGALPSLLAVLDEKPFEFLTKAGRDPDLARGGVAVEADLGLILKKGLSPDEITLDATGAITDLVSDRIVKGRELRAERMEIAADRGRIRATGQAVVDGVAFDGFWQQALSGEDRGRGRVEGRIALSPEGLARFGVKLPQGLARGAGSGDLALDLVPDEPPAIELATDLRGIGLSLPAVEWSKPASVAGRLRVSGRLGPVPRIDNLEVSAPGLDARGRVVLAEGPRFEALELDRVALGGWLDAAVSIRARGPGRPPAISVRGGEIDIRRARLGGGGGGATGAARGPVALRLDRLVVTDTVALTGFAVDLAPGTGLAGSFKGRVNGGVTVSGRLDGGPRGATIRLGSGDAGAVLRDAGLIERVEGGAMALTLIPIGDEGSYDGRLRISGTRLEDAPAAVELLSAISGVGLVEQLQGQGIVFDEVDAEFRLTPSRITLYRSSATGASLGISMDGVYDPVRRVMDMQGVVSPVYLLNRVGSIFTRQGEGLFGVSFTLRGPVSAPAVAVNPLSILTPGAFREIFPPAAAGALTFHLKAGWRYGGHEEGLAMQLSDFDFDLPERLIATRPARPRSSARMLVTDGSAIDDARVADLPDRLRPGDRLVLNDTKVIPARLAGTRARDGHVAKVEATLLEPQPDGSWTALVKHLRKIADGEEIVFAAGLSARLERQGDGMATLRFNLSGEDFDAALSRAGAMPLPPYIAARRPADAQDREDYQTIWARHAGAVAAPTASLHFDAALMAALRARGIATSHVTLHVGAGTFLPVKVDDIAEHQMHAERGVVSGAAAAEMAATRSAGGRLIAVGTTALRLMETAARETGEIRPWQGATDIFITPGFRFRATDGLVTNFHLPRSTLMMLVSAFLGVEEIRRVYAHAIAAEYRFFSYGDASLLLPRRDGIENVSD